jgi:hypothetical protein
MGEGGRKGKTYSESSFSRCTVVHGPSDDIPSAVDVSEVASVGRRSSGESKLHAEQPRSRHQSNRSLQSHLAKGRRRRKPTIRLSSLTMIGATGAKASYTRNASVRSVA